MFLKAGSGGFLPSELRSPAQQAHFWSSVQLSSRIPQRSWYQCCTWQAERLTQFPWLCSVKAGGLLSPRKATLSSVSTKTSNGAN